MCFTYRILEPMDSNIHLSMFSPALEKATSRPEVEFSSVFCFQFTPTETVELVEASGDDDDSDDEYFDALSGDNLEWPTMEDLEHLSAIDEDWSQNVWTQEDWNHKDWSHEDWVSEDIHTKENDIQTDEDDTQTEVIDTSDETGHPLAGWHSPRLANSDWTNHSFVDKSDHIDMWVRHSESDYSLARCNWVVFPEDSWSKPEDDSVWGAPELRLVTPEGEVCWLDDATDYEALPWEREVAEERNRILSAIW